MSRTLPAWRWRTALVDFYSRMPTLRQIVILVFLASPGNCHNTNDVCEKESCGSDDSEDIDWEEEDVPRQLRSWVAQQRSKNKIVFCRDEKEEAAVREEAVPLYKYERCDFMDYWTEYSYEGKRDGDNKFKGPGRLVFKTDVGSNYNRGGGGGHNNRIGNKKEFCIIDNAFMSLSSVSGRFKAGLPTGEVRIVQNNHAELVGQAVAGVLHGKVLIRNKNGGLVFLGRYRDGQPRGWGWVFSPDDPDQSSGALYVRFEDGRVDSRLAVVVEPGYQRAWIGRYDGEENCLQQAVRFSIPAYGDKGCIRQIKLPAYEAGADSGEAEEVQVALPVHIKLVGGRLSVVSSRLLMFNRVPKAGSQSLIKLMVELGGGLGYKVSVDQRTVEEYNSPPWEQLQLAETVSTFTEPTVWVRHFNFLDFDSLGLATPSWINMVRDPVERVISNFYYRRAGWNIVERKLAFPDEPLPDPAFLRRDFESCVLEGDPECSYLENSIDTAWETGDHRRQMMLFCGQREVCARFNNQEALELAKRNVAKHYSVVGVLELWEDSLEVMEHQLPFFFRGAREVYKNKFQQVRKMSQNFHKGFVSEEIKEIVRRNFSREIEFYEFCKERLQVQLDQIRGRRIN